MEEGLRPGSILRQGYYSIEEVLGEGDFEITYLAKDIRLDRTVTIKEFFPKDYCKRDEDARHVMLRGPHAVQLVIRLKSEYLKEAKAAAGTDSPDGTRIEAVFEENNTAYCVMEAAEGTPAEKIAEADAKGAIASNKDDVNGVKDCPEEQERSLMASEWDMVLAEADIDVRVDKINRFFWHYAMDPSDEALHYIDEAIKELYRIDDEKETRKDWNSAKQTNTILGYVDFVTKHPCSDYREEADSLIKEMKGDILADMKRRPFNYWREEMYDYISTNTLTMSDLVDSSGTLTERAYNQIKCYPELRYEQDCLPVTSDEPADDIVKGNVDVLFIGVCGSGGKTCLMGSLMSLAGESRDFIYRESYKNKECDNTYGYLLAEYLKSNRLPPATDMYYTQVINTLVRCKDKKQGVSFIEFAGEQIHALAGHDVDESLSAKLGQSFIKILNNDNKKIIILTLDPTNVWNIQICGPTQDSEGLNVCQSDTLSHAISYLDKAPKFMRNVIGLHTIMSKSDVWLKGSPVSSIDRAIDTLGAKDLLSQIEQLCNKYKIINSNTYPIPFSIGRFMAGNTYEFDNRDAKKLLHLIKKDIESYDRQRSALSRLKDYFNN